MKIVIATFTYSPNVDGVANAAKNMVEIFSNAGHEVMIATSILPYPHASSEKDTRNVRRFSISGSPAMASGFQGEISNYQKFLTELRPDAVFFHCWDIWTSVLAMPLTKSISAKSIMVSHGYDSHLLNPKILPRGLWKWLRWLPLVLSMPWRLRQFDKVVFLSRKTDLNRFFDAWVARWTRCQNTTVIPNGINTMGWELLPDNFRHEEQLSDGVFFLCVANYFLGKNHEMALKAFTQAHISGSTLVFIGSSLGEYGNRVREDWNQMKGKFPTLDVRFYENVDRHRVISAIRSCDIAILASKTEAQPLTILEAMACSKPFICTNVGCVSEFKGGIVVESLEEMVAHMQRLAEDSNERFRLGVEAKIDFDTNYSAEVTAKAWLKLINSLISTTS